MGAENPDSDTTFWKAGVLVFLIATLIASGATVYVWQGDQNEISTASSYQASYEVANVHLALASQSLSAVESQASEHASNILLSGVTFSLTNSSTLILSYNGTLAGYILLNGTTASRSWVVACYGVSTLAGCESQVASGTGYIRLLYSDGVQVPVIPGPMVISMSSDAQGQIAITATAYT